MTINSSGPVSLGGTTAGQSIGVELGGTGTTQISLNDSSVRTLADVPSGAITMPTNFYGKSNTFSFSFSGGTNVNLRAAAVSAGWNQSAAVIATNTGNVISSSTSTAALIVDGSFPNGVTLINNGNIVGKGGNGGIGGLAPSSRGGNGTAGGTGLSVSVAVSINNTSNIAGGGGGGGGGGGRFSEGWYGGGGGGGAGFGTGASAYGGAGNGTLTSPGAGGVSASPLDYGGSGGGWGATGSSGNASFSGFQGSGGAAGAAVTGNGNITWIATGNRYGPVS